ncbi:glucose-1-phosphatase [Xenorhabdus thuongxuanensis]|uniref:2-haloalkanoic acid dehalogenase n=1 Tax=Xenorhabdus thuongxuanensis TaxID=1873484 RepID=A0A1Q5U2H4_9GAMM|nr:glucose-1-phosphatase [Xenorhabdus thuongxuanensis]OKP06672.1 2-haloalkanoic acid dehalogenase [Xenorhabdus thuongxuanensis]
MLYIFDLGNVIIDIDFKRVLAVWSNLSGTPLATLTPKFSQGEAIEKHECGKISDTEFAERMCDEMEVSLSFKQFAEGWNTIFIGVRQEVIELMNKLRAQGHRVVVLSNTNRLHIDYCSVHYPEIAVSADFLYLSHELRMRKPNLDIFNYVLAAEGVTADQAIFFDDLLENVEAAKKSGINVIHVADRSVIPDYFKSHDFSLPSKN